MIVAVLPEGNATNPVQVEFSIRLTATQRLSGAGVVLHPLIELMDPATLLLQRELRRGTTLTLD